VELIKLSDYSGSALGETFLPVILQLLTACDPYFNDY